MTIYRDECILCRMNEDVDLGDVERSVIMQAWELLAPYLKTEDFDLFRRRTAVAVASLAETLATDELCRPVADWLIAQARDMVPEVSDRKRVTSYVLWTAVRDEGSGAVSLSLDHLVWGFVDDLWRLSDEEAAS